MAQGDPRKWHMPGWRIEQKFSPGVLIGNWGEDRHTVCCATYDYINQNEDSLIRTTTRGRNILKTLGRQIFFLFCSQVLYVISINHKNSASNKCLHGNMI